MIYNMCEVFRVEFDFKIYHHVLHVYFEITNMFKFWPYLENEFRWMLTWVSKRITFDMRQQHFRKVCDFDQR